LPERKEAEKEPNPKKRHQPRCFVQTANFHSQEGEDKETGYRQHRQGGVAFCPPPRKIIKGGEGKMEPTTAREKTNTITLMRDRRGEERDEHPKRKHKHYDQRNHRRKEEKHVEPSGGKSRIQKAGFCEL